MSLIDKEKAVIAEIAGKNPAGTWQKKMQNGSFFDEPAGESSFIADYEITTPVKLQQQLAEVTDEPGFVLPLSVAVFKLRLNTQNTLHSKEVSSFIYEF